MAEAERDTRSNILDDICKQKLEHVSKQKSLVPETMLREQISFTGEVRQFHDALNKKIQKKQTSIIAEVKKASPSKGVIRKDFDPVSIAKSYENAGATCISVLTDEPYFQGKDQYLTDIKLATNLPILRKDFMLDPYQIVESKAIGADCILLIMAALSLQQAQELEVVAHELQMDVLVEVHNEKELDQALRLNSTLIGINNRDLKTLKIDLSTAEDLSAQIPYGYTIVCESGITSRDDIKAMHKAHLYAFLIGESLMKQEDIEKALKDLLA